MISRSFGDTSELIEEDVSNEAPGIDRDPRPVAAWMEKMDTVPARDKSDDDSRKSSRRDKTRRRRDGARDRPRQSSTYRKPIALGATPTPLSKPAPTP